MQGLKTNHESGRGGWGVARLYIRNLVVDLTIVLAALLLVLAFILLRDGDLCAAFKRTEAPAACVEKWILRGDPAVYEK